MELLFLLAHASDDGDALMLLVLAVPAFVLIFYALSIALGRKYEQSADGKWESVDDEEDE